VNVRRCSNADLERYMPSDRSRSPRCKSGRPRPRCAPASDRLRPRVEIAHVTGRNQRPRC
jgi:hypothetical protein